MFNLREHYLWVAAYDQDPLPAPRQVDVILPLRYPQYSLSVGLWPAVRAVSRLASLNLAASVCQLWPPVSLLIRLQHCLPSPLSRWDIQM